MEKQKLESHGVEHVKEVQERALKINTYLENKLGIHADIGIINIAAQYHDVTAIDDRENHHKSGANLFLKECKDKYGQITKRKVYQCIWEHRASYKEEYSSIESQILSTADRDEINPSSIDKLFKRAYIYSKEHGLDHDVAVEKAYYHIKEKYGRDGYAFNSHNKVFFIYYEENLKDFWNALELTSLEAVYQILEPLRNQEI